MKNAQAAIDRLCDPTTEVSAHYVIARTGEITKLVPEEQRAWHAGAGEWRGQQDVNSRSIGIELDNNGAQPFPEPQMHALEMLLKGIKERWPVEATDIIGHSDLAPDRKIDPGPRFDWARLARQGLAGPCAPIVAEDFPTAARAVGFTAPVSPECLLAATRLRFAPWRTGPQSAEDMKLYYPQ